MLYWPMYRELWLLSITLCKYKRLFRKSLCVVATTYPATKKYQSVTCLKLDYKEKTSGHKNNVGQLHLLRTAQSGSCLYLHLVLHKNTTHSFTAKCFVTAILTGKFGTEHYHLRALYHFDMTASDERQITLQ